MEFAMLWFACSFFDVSTGTVLERQIHGPYEDSGSVDDAIDEKMAEATGLGDSVIVIPVKFELCTDDVPEVIDED